VPVGVTFTVPGEAVPQGNLRAVTTGKGNIRLIDKAQRRGQPWRAAIQWMARQEMRGGALITGPVCVIIRFDRPRPMGHFGKNGLNASGRRSAYPATRPDLGKLARAIEDALTGIVYRDDSQIVEEHLEKRWGPVAQTTVAVWIKEPD
jgi:crossover junction endodeoxyribonuclease RusA